MFNTSTVSEDSFTELKSGATTTSLPVPVSLPLNSPKSAVDESTPRTRISRTLSFDDDASPSRRPRSTCSAARPSLTARRRCQRNQPSSYPLPRTSTATDEDFGRTEPCPCHVTMPSSVISSCIEEDDERADLIGDLTKKHVLPLEPNLKHPDLKTISPHTVSCCNWK